MKPIGFSTGALALGDFRRALRSLSEFDVSAVELSALRLDELASLLSALTSLDLRRFRYVSVHAPSKFAAAEEEGIIDQLKHVADRGFNVVLHPDAMHDVKAWRRLGRRLCIENMDKRKPVGRTASELREFFTHLPEAGLCFDIAHARQVDSSMTVAYRLLREFRDRIRQVHISEVDTSSKHARMSTAAIADYAEVAHLIPDDAAVIVEAQVDDSQIASELLLAGQALQQHEAVGAPASQA